MFEYPTGPVPPTVQQHKKSHKGAWITFFVVFGIVLVFCVGVSIFTVLAANKDKSAATTPPGSSSTPTDEPRTSPSPADKPTTKAPTKVTVPTTVENGEWTAGPDFQVGKYQTTTKSGDCVWQVTTGQGESVHYVDPGHVGAGHYVFTFKAGETLHTQNCGTWTKM